MAPHPVLLVDDNDLLIELFTLYASGSGEIALRAARDIETALDLIDEENPALVLLDNRLMPYKSYKETVPLLRGRGFVGRIVVISAAIGDPIFQDCASHGVSGCIDKFDLRYDTFDRIVKALLP